MDTENITEDRRAESLAAFKSESARLLKIIKDAEEELGKIRYKQTIRGEAVYFMVARRKESGYGWVVTNSFSNIATFSTLEGAEKAAKSNPHPDIKIEIRYKVLPVPNLEQIDEPEWIAWLTQRPRLETGLNIN